MPLSSSVPVIADFAEGACVAADGPTTSTFCTQLGRRLTSTPSSHCRQPRRLLRDPRVVCLGLVLACACLVVGAPQAAARPGEDVQHMWTFAELGKQTETLDRDHRLLEVWRALPADHRVKPSSEVQFVIAAGAAQSPTAKGLLIAKVNGRPIGRIALSAARQPKETFAFALGRIPVGTQGLHITLHYCQLPHGFLSLSTHQLVFSVSAQCLFAFEFGNDAFELPCAFALFGHHLGQRLVAGVATCPQKPCSHKNVW